MDKKIVRVATGLVIALLLGVVGGALLCDERGLRREFFLLDVGWQGEPLFSDVSMPHVEKLEDLRGVTVPSIFSVRWRGWLWVETSGPHEFSISADDAGYLVLDGTRLTEISGRRARVGAKKMVDLERGFHAIEIGLSQKDAEVALAVQWTPPGGERELLPAEILHGARPLSLYRWLRRATAPIGPIGGRLLGALLVLLAFLGLRAVWLGSSLGRKVYGSLGRIAQGAFNRVPVKLRERLSSRRVVYAGFFLALFLATWIVSMPWTVATFSGDDANYIRASQFGDMRLGFFNRMVHVHLLRTFIAVFGGGDSFLGSRVYGGFVLAVTVVALAFAIRQLGPRLQLRTLAVTLFLLFSQVTLTGAVGAAFTDSTLMMFLTLALAVFLHCRSGEKIPPRHEWHSLALGVLTLAACKSKVTGVIVFFLVALLVYADGRIDWRRFGRRLVYWFGGVLAALLVLMTADAIWVGDFFWSVRPENFKGSLGGLLGAKTIDRPELGWLHVLQPEGARGAGLGLRNLWILVIVAPFVAAARRVRFERRLLYLFPALYLLMLIVIYSRLRAPLFSGRMLIPIIPAACFVGGAILFHLGIERFQFREALTARSLIPLGLVTAVIVFVVVPYQTGVLAPEELVPLDYAEHYGWEPGHFLRATQIPAILLAGLLVASLCFHGRRRRLALALLAVLAFFGASFDQSTSSLAHRTTAQHGELILYPWRAFKQEIEAADPKVIQVSPDVFWRLGMLGKGPTTTAMIFFDRSDIFVSLEGDLPSEAELAIASRRAFEIWRRKAPELAATATFDASRQLVLLRPERISK